MADADFSRGPSSSFELLGYEEVNFVVPFSSDASVVAAEGSRVRLNGLQLPAGVPVRVPSGKPISLYTLKKEGGRVEVLDYKDSKKGVPLLVECGQHEYERGEEGEVGKARKARYALHQLYRSLIRLSEDGKGKVSMLVGKHGSGRASAFFTLGNLFRSKYGKVVMVDMDVGQGSLGIPGVVGAALVEEQILLGEGKLSEKEDLFLAGGISPDRSPIRFDEAARLCAKSMRKMMEGEGEGERERDASGERYEEGEEENEDEPQPIHAIVQLCGWLDETGVQEMMKKCVEIFQPSNLIVLESAADQNLRQHIETHVPFEPSDITYLNNSTMLTKAQLSVGNTDKMRKSLLRDTRIASYFYGIDRTLVPVCKSVSQLKVYEFVEVEQDENVAVEPALSVKKGEILAVSTARKADDIKYASVSGFVYVDDAEVVTSSGSARRTSSIRAIICVPVKLALSISGDEYFLKTDLVLPPKLRPAPVQGVRSGSGGEGGGAAGRRSE